MSLAACGGGDDDDDTPDSGTSIDGGDAPDAASASCTEFDSPAGTISGAPGSYNGTTAGAGADLLVAEGVCADERSYYAPAGDDQVVLVTGLTAGTEYYARVASAADLALYVATGCSDTAGGPGAGDCLLFADATLAGESGPFTAPAGGQVYIVVDQFGTDPVDDATYTLDVYEAECSTAEDCTDADDHACLDGLCVGCVTAFDCPSSDAPACVSNECAAGFDQCTGDDGAENGDDGPSGATAIDLPTAGNPTSANGAICSLPAAEADYYKFTATGGETLVVTLDWAGSEDLDIIVFDEDGQDLAFGFFDQPEAVRVADLAAGTYYVQVTMYDPADTAAAVAYTLSLSIPECDNSFDCEDPTKPVCSASYNCAAGPADCTGDDSREDDDGPAAATDATPGVGADVTFSDGKICNTPGNEADFFAVTTVAGDNLDIELSWEGAADLDLATMLSDGTVTGITYWQSPETISLTNLPAGTHYIQVTYYGDPITAAVGYTLNVARTNTGGCSAVADCAAVWDTQLFRGACNSGACEFIAGDGGIANGALCDSPDDCTSGICSYVAFESDAAKSVCSVSCTADADCSSLGGGYKCTTPFSSNFCHPTCTAHTDCGANLGSGTLDADQPWDYLTCNAGACDL